MELILFVGLQASGKSTFYQRYFAETHIYVSKDAFRNNKRPARRQQTLIEEALKAGRSAVVDNTNPTVEDRAQLISLGRQYAASIIAYYFESEVKLSLARNKQRSGKARVPDVAIYVTAKKLLPPTLIEGFDRLYYVRIEENGVFSIRAIEHET